MDLSLIFLGDVMLARYIDINHYIHDDVIHYIKSANVRICNFEGAISSDSASLYKIESKPGQYICKHGVTAEQAQILVDLDINCCNIANNHILDYGYEGVKETIRFLNDNNIKWFGFGKDYDVAWKPRIYNLRFNDNEAPPGKDKLKIAFFGISDHFVEWKAHDCAGINYFDIDNLTTDGSGNPNHSMWTNMENIYDKIKKIRRRCDIIVFSIHWGDNFQDSVSLSFRNFAHLLIDNGVDVIHGHSTHHTQGIESYRSGLIMFGCGEFLNDYDMMEKVLSKHGETLGVAYEKYRSDLSFIYKLHMKYEEKIKFCTLEMFPIQIKKGFVTRCIDDESKNIIFKKMIADCESLDTKVYQKGNLLYIPLG